MAPSVIWDIHDGNYPAGLATDSLGNVWAVFSNSSGAYGTRKYDKDGVLILTADNLTPAVGIGIDSLDNVYVCHANAITKISPNGSTVWSTPIEAGVVQSFTVDKAGNSAVAIELPKLPSTSHVVKSSSIIVDSYSSSGGFRWRRTIMEYTNYDAGDPGYVDAGGVVWEAVFSNDGDLLISYRLFWKSSNIQPIVYTYQYTVEKINSSGGIAWTRATDSASQVYAAAFDSNGNLYEATVPAMVTKRGPDGSFIWSKSAVNGYNDDISSMIVDSVGAILVGYFWPGALVKLDAQGDQLWILEFPSANSDIVALSVDSTSNYIFKTHYYGPITKIGDIRIVNRAFYDGFVLGYQSGCTESAASIALTTASYGPKGPDGPMGPVGPDGEKGLTGLSGATGAQGPKGLTGVAGPDGIDGVDGIQGPPGEDGLPGADGPKGPKGVPGSDGVDGTIGPPVPVFNDIHFYNDGVVVTRSDLTVLTYTIAKDAQKRIVSIKDTIVEHIDGLMP